MSVDSFAKSLGKSSRAIRLAIDKGALAEAVVLVNGKPKIADAARARALYEEHTRPREVNGTPTTAAAAGYQTARAAREAENARLAELKREAVEIELARKRGDLIPAAEVRAALSAEYSAVKAKLSAIPTRARAEMPHLTAADVARLQEMVDEALAELADEDLAPGVAA